MVAFIFRGVSGPFPPDPVGLRLLPDHPALRLLLRLPDRPRVVKPKPQPARRPRGRVYNEKDRGQRLLAVMAERQVGHCTAAKCVCREDFAGLDTGACEKRLQRWYLAQKRR
jgi:hypothetical protein